MLKINNKKRELLVKLAEKYALKLLVLFGSQVTGRIHKESDYDIAFLSGRSLTLEEEARMSADLLPIVQPSDERLLSVTNIRRASPLLLKNIFSESQILFVRDRNILDTYRIYALRKFLEARPLFELRDYQINRYFTHYAK